MWSIHVTRFVVGKSLGKIMLHVRCFSKFAAVMCLAASVANLAIFQIDLSIFKTTSAGKKLNKRTQKIDPI